MNNVINVNQQANIYLNELKNSIATWNYACNEATEYEGQLSETSRHWEGCRQDAANDVFNKHINLSAHCIQYKISNDAFWKWQDIALRIGTYEIRQRNKLKDADAEAA